MKLSNKEMFIEKARKVHGDRYNYDDVIYINSGTNVMIGCPIHKLFTQTPENHLAGKGCFSCGRKVVSKEMFIERSNIVHNGKYSYDKLIFTKLNSRGIITCPVHGDINQDLRLHIQGYGCKRCAAGAGNKEDFIAKARRVHGDRYDYSKVVYVSVDTKVEIGCKEHSFFTQTPYVHLKGSGCRKCVFKIHDRESFIAVAKEKHGGRYTYENVVYEFSNKKVEITCGQHGAFMQEPSVHVSGAGCPRCARNFHQSAEEIIERMHKKHNHKYEYDISTIKRGNDKIKIMCPIHGTFWQQLNNHLFGGNGCPECAVGMGERYCRYAFEKIFGKEFTSCRPDFLKYKNNLELDGYCAELNIAFEYQGPYHYREVQANCRLHDTLADRIRRDAFKRKRCVELGIKLIEIPYFKPGFTHENLKQFIKEKCVELGIEIPDGFDEVILDKKEVI